MRQRDLSALGLDPRVKPEDDGVGGWHERSEVPKGYVRQVKEKSRSVAAAAPILSVVGRAPGRSQSYQAETSSSVDSTRQSSVMAAAASR